MIVTSPAPAPVEAKLTALLDELIGADSARALTGAMNPDGYPILIVTARRGALTSSLILDLDIAAELTAEQLEEEVRCMIDHALLELDGGENGSGSS